MGYETDDKKEHFNDLYNTGNPVPFKTEIMDRLTYICDDFTRQEFDRHILPFCMRKSGGGETVNYVDLCSCFGNTSMAVLRGMTTDEIKDNWSTDERCETIDKPTRFKVKCTGIDISKNALAYGKRVGLYQETLNADLNHLTPEETVTLTNIMSSADVILSTAALVYLRTSTIEKILSAFASKKSEGYVIVNFLNPFSIEEANEIKKMLLKYLKFEGSVATRHRKLSEKERKSYPDEEWALLEIWILSRRV
eukprot:Clim_evm51s199 gene=Clim_evmTU51s199